jgi:hypothetical protein
VDSLIRRRALLLTGLRPALALLLSLAAVRVSGEQLTEYQVKAAFLLNFTRFVEWPEPENRNSPFLICIVGDDPFGSSLDLIVQGETVNGRKIVVSRVRREAPASCALIYVSASEKNVRETLAAAGPGVLTVGEGDGFLDEGGMIAFVIDNRHVRFNVDPAAAQKAGLKISSKLLNVARSVR